MNIGGRCSLKVSKLATGYSHSQVKSNHPYMTSFSNQHTSWTNTFSVDELKRAAQLFPQLSHRLKKGDCGKVGVIGGSAQYTGAPYFAACTPIKIGADLSYLFCHPDASAIIKGYSPELMVDPTLDFHLIEASLSRLDVVVFGPGIGRDKQVLVPLLKKLIQYVHNTLSVCLLIDADGIFLLGECLDYIKQCKNVIVTPNHREFKRLYEAAFEVMDNSKNEGVAVQVKKLAAHLGICIFRKGDFDVISDGEQVLVGCQPGTLRRCGGQGDILSGATALFAYWAKLKTGSEMYNTQHILQGALAASDFVRFTSRLTFQRIGRSMNAADVIAQIPDVVKRLDDSTS